MSDLSVRMDNQKCVIDTTKKSSKTKQPQKLIEMGNYEAFRSMILPNHIKWRSHTPNLDIMCMPDQSPNSGSLLQTHIHIHGQYDAILLRYVYSCSCDMYVHTKLHPSFNLGGNNGCLHCIYFSTVINQYIPQYFSDGNNPNTLFSFYIRCSNGVHRCTSNQLYVYHIHRIKLQSILYYLLLIKYIRVLMLNYRRTLYTAKIGSVIITTSTRGNQPRYCCCCLPLRVRG